MQLLQRDHTLCCQLSSNMSSAELLLQLGKDPGCFCDTEIMLLVCLPTLIAAPAGSAAHGGNPGSAVLTGPRLSGWPEWSLHMLNCPLLLGHDLAMTWQLCSTCSVAVVVNISSGTAMCATNANCRIDVFALLSMWAILGNHTHEAFHH